jgi:hypothetical protein
MTAQAGALYNVFSDPASGEMNIRWSQTLRGTLSVALYSVTGERVYGTTVEGGDGDGAGMRIAPALRNGAYLLSVSSGKASANMIVIVSGQ